MTTTSIDTTAATAALHSRHLLGIAGLEADEITLVLDTAVAMKEIGGRAIKKVPTLRGRTVVNLFFEPSTRTRVSFELAAKRLGADVVNLDLHSSSRVKGETVLDTLYTLQAMMVDVFVMRDSEPGLPAFAETCPQYLFCSQDDLARPDFEGAKYVCTPALRPAHMQEDLWRGLKTHDLQVVSTDGAPREPRREGRRGCKVQKGKLLQAHS